MFINPVHQIRAEFALFDHPATISMFAQGRILLDTDGTVATLVAEAQRIWRAGPPIVGSDHRWQLHYRPTDLLTDARDLLDADPAAANLVMALTVLAALDTHHRLAGRWSVKPKHLLQDLAGHDPDLADLARQVLRSDESAARRWELLVDLVEKILAPIGGHPSEWESPWEAVPEPPGPV